VRAEHDALRPDRTGEEAEGRSAVSQGVEVELLEVLAGRALDVDLALRPHLPAMVPAIADIRACAAAVRKVDLEPRELLEHAAEDQAGRGDRRVHGVADEVCEVVAAQPLLQAGHTRG